jgi:hypothetical protein
MSSSYEEQEPQSVVHLMMKLGIKASRSFNTKKPATRSPSGGALPRRSASNDLKSMQRGVINRKLSTCSTSNSTSSRGSTANASFTASALSATHHYHACSSQYSIISLDSADDFSSCTFDGEDFPTLNEEEEAPSTAESGDASSSASTNAEARPFAATTNSSMEFLYSSQFYHSMSEEDIKSQCLSTTTEGTNKAVIYFFDASETETMESTDRQLAKLAMLNRSIRFVRIDRNSVSSDLEAVLNIQDAQGSVVVALKNGQVVSTLFDLGYRCQAEDSVVSKWFLWRSSMLWDF